MLTLPLLERPNVFRQPLTFSHHVILVKAGARRGPLIEQTLSRGWSVRELRRRWLTTTIARSKGAVAVAKRSTRRISHLALEVERIVDLLPALHPEATREGFTALRDLHRRVADTFAEFEAIHEELGRYARGYSRGVEPVVREA